MTLAKLRETVAIDVAEHFAGKRWILKSLWEHASVGLDDRAVINSSHVATILRELESRLDRLGGTGFAEEYIDGREFNIALLGGGDEVAPGLWMPEALPAAEIVFLERDAWGARPRIVNYDCKWDEQSFEYTHTERVFDFGEEDAPLLERMIQVARACWVIFGLRGYARVDFRVDSKGEPWVLEVNSNPCLSPDSGFVAALERGNITYPHAIERILEDALRQPHAPSATTS
jgi:D-alanine-D-alanine ligase